VIGRQYSRGFRSSGEVESPEKSEKNKHNNSGERGRTHAGAGASSIHKRLASPSPPWWPLLTPHPV